MGGSNFGRSHEPQQCGGAHLPNTLSSPNAALAGGIGGPPEHRLPDDPHPKKPRITSTLPTPHTAATTTLPEHQKLQQPRQGVPGGRAPRAR